MGQIIKDQKETNRKISYEDISSTLEERPDLIYRIDEDVLDYDFVISEYIRELKDYLDVEVLNDNEKKLGLALIEV